MMRLRAKPVGVSPTSSAAADSYSYCSGESETFNCLSRAGWSDSFDGSERYERFQAAVESLESTVEALESVDVSWG